MKSLNNKKQSKSLTVLKYVQHHKTIILNEAQRHAMQQQITNFLFKQIFCNKKSTLHSFFLCFFCSHSNMDIFLTTFFVRLMLLHVWILQIVDVFLNFCLWICSCLLLDLFAHIYNPKMVSNIPQFFFIRCFVTKLIW